MTVLYTNTFTGSNGSAPSDLTLSTTGTAGTTDIQSNKLRMATAAVAFSGQRAILPSGNWNEADGKVTIFFTTQAAADSMLPEVHLRTDGSWSATEADSAVNGYKMLWNPGGNIELYKRVADTTSGPLDSAAFSLSPSTTYGMTFECVGTTIRGRMWDASGSEPGTWDVTTTDASLAGPGQFQLCLLTTTAGVRDVRWDDLSLDDLTTPATDTRRPVFRRF